MAAQLQSLEASLHRYEWLKDKPKESDLRGEDEIKLLKAVKNTEPPIGSQALSRKDAIRST